MKRLTMATAFAVAALTLPAWAQSPAEHDSHHPADGAQSAPAPAIAAPGVSQPGVGAMQGCMGNMSMMGMMQTMGMMGPGMGGMATIDRVEGRIAFLRAELKITDAQASAWNGFAEALRANARKLAEVRASMMARPGDAQRKASTMADRLDQQEQWLQARLDGTRTMKAALAKLNETLSDDQKKAADDLLAPHMGMGMMGRMGRMGSQMGSGRTQPGQMQMPGMRNN